MLRSLASIFSGYLVMASAIAFLAAIWLLNPNPVPGAWFMAFGIVCAFCFAILGGYLTVLIADHAYIKHSLGLALLAALTGVLLMVLLAGVLPLWPERRWLMPSRGNPKISRQGFLTSSLRGSPNTLYLSRALPAPPGSKTDD